MVRLSRILRDYQDAGSVNGLLALWGFVDDDVSPRNQPRGRRLSASGAWIRGSLAPPAAGARASLRGGASAPWTNTAASTNTLNGPLGARRAQCEQPVANEAIQRRGRLT
jgi:hypothetical protein